MQTYKSYAKVNVFLKIVGFESGYHQIISRFVRVPSLYDVMWFEPGDGKGFSVVGDFDCAVQDNTIYRAYEKLVKELSYKRLSDFLQTHKVVVYKKIPSKAGLGGGSSNAATFLHMVNDELGLLLSARELQEIGKSVGADVNFFLSGYQSANVFGFGDDVQEFFEEPLSPKIYTPQIECSTVLIYKNFRKNYSDRFDANKRLAAELLQMSSLEILRRFKAKDLNDLYQSAINLYPEVSIEAKEHYFFSGSGSSFFYL